MQIMCHVFAGICKAVKEEVTSMGTKKTLTNKLIDMGVMY